MELLAGPFAIVSVVLAIGGITKVVDPTAATATMRSVGLPDQPILARGLGIVEIVLGAGAMLAGGWALPLAVAIVYVAFTAVMWALVVGGSTASCGCFGSADSPPSWMHVGVNGVSAAVAAAAAAVSVVGFFELLADQPAAGVPMVIFVATGTAATIALFTLVPRLGAPSTRTAVQTFHLNS